MDDQNNNSKDVAQMADVEGADKQQDNSATVAEADSSKSSVQGDSSAGVAEGVLLAGEADSELANNKLFSKADRKKIKENAPKEPLALSLALKGEEFSAIAEKRAKGGESVLTSADEQSASIEPINQGGEPSSQHQDVKKELNWYVVHVYSGFEHQVKRVLEERIRNSSLADQFGLIKVPEEKVVELVRGQKRESNKKFFPGYILVQMALNEETWHLVKGVPKVTGFVGDSMTPEPLTEEEVERLMQQMEEGALSPRAKISFEEGEAVKVIDGPFKDFNGTVEEVKPDKGKVKVLISIFGRATPVELDFVQVEKG